MGAMPGRERQISQRDLRLRSKEIMDAVERGQAFEVTRAGRAIGELVPRRESRRFVVRADFAFGSRAAASVDLERFRADLDGAYADSTETVDPYAR